MTKEQINDYYAGCKSTADLDDYLVDNCTNGYDTAFDGSLSVFHFEEFSVVVTSSEYYFVTNSD